MKQIHRTPFSHLKADAGLRMAYPCFRKLLDYIVEKTFHKDTFPSLGHRRVYVKIPLKDVTPQFAKEVILPWVLDWNENKREERRVGDYEVDPYLVPSDFGEEVSLVIPLRKSEAMTLAQYINGV